MIPPDALPLLWDVLTRIGLLTTNLQNQQSPPHNGISAVPWANQCGIVFRCAGYMRTSVVLFRCDRKPLHAPALELPVLLQENGWSLSQKCSDVKNWRILIADTEYLASCSFPVLLSVVLSTTFSSVPLINLWFRIDESLFSTLCRLSDVNKSAASHRTELTLSPLSWKNVYILPTF